MCLFEGYIGKCNSYLWLGWSFSVCLSYLAAEHRFWFCISTVVTTTDNKTLGRNLHGREICPLSVEEIWTRYFRYLSESCYFRLCKYSSTRKSPTLTVLSMSICYAKSSLSRLVILRIMYITELYLLVHWCVSSLQCCKWQRWNWSC